MTSTAPDAEPSFLNRVISNGTRQYWLNASLGRGNFAWTYWGYDSWHNQIVFKILHKKASEARENWTREIQSLIAFRHPNITFIYDAFEFEDRCCIVMEHCGQSLKDMFGMKDFTGSVWFKPVARCVLQALDFIHRADHVHKDVHVGNVLVTFLRNEFDLLGNQSMSIKLADFGISRGETELEQLNATFARWMIPPEVLDPKFGPVKRTVDIYHAALLLLATLAGRELEFLPQQILEGEPRQYAEALGAPFGPPLAKALRRHVKDRTQSVFELWNDLHLAGAIPLPSA